jgi:hypothetical protein
VTALFAKIFEKVEDDESQDTLVDVHHSLAGRGESMGFFFFSKQLTLSIYTLLPNGDGI